MEERVPFFSIYKTFWNFHCLLQSLSMVFFLRHNIHNANTLSFSWSLLSLKNVTFLQLHFWFYIFHTYFPSPFTALTCPVVMCLQHLLPLLLIFLAPWSLLFQHFLATNIETSPWDKPSFPSDDYLQRIVEAQLDVFKMEGDSFIHLQVQRSAWENPMGYSFEENKGPEELADFQDWLFWTQECPIPTNT